jgi:hypothetical protein
MVTWNRRQDTFPYVELAKYYEHRLRDFEKAVAFVNQALEQIPSHHGKEIELLHYRKKRLQLKRTGHASG